MLASNESNTLTNAGAASPAARAGSGGPPGVIDLRTADDTTAPASVGEADLGAPGIGAPDTGSRASRTSRPTVMEHKLRAAARMALLRLGRRLSVERLHDARNILGALTLGRWLADNPAATGHALARADKTDVYRDALARVTGTKPLYLEFGVWEGLSLRWWVSNLHSPGARFVGFDSFEGIPETWRPDYPPGTFAVGQPPAICDDRVSFEIGWFKDTLPVFDIPEHDQLIVNIDCTLYSSTATALQTLEPHFRPGDLIYFDELPEYDHELRAFLEHNQRTDLRLVPISHSRGYYWLFQYAAPSANGETSPRH